MKQLKITKRVTKRDTTSLDKYLQEIGRVELITPEEEVDLARKIKIHDMNALNKLIKANLRFVVSVSKQYQNQGLTLPDLINEGNLGLIKAASRFDETKGFKFISYAVWWIRQSILQALAEQARIVRLPLNKIGSLNKINQTFAKLMQSFEREPTMDEIATDLSVPPKDIKEAMMNNGLPISMDAPLQSDEETTLHDRLPNNDVLKPDRKLLKESLSKEIDRILSTLSPREAEIIRLYYGLNEKHPFTLEEIGEKFDLTRERVRQIKGKTIKILKTKSKILRPYL